MMADALTPIAAKLATFIRLLSSDKDGEVVVAARAMQRTLKAVGADIHALADRVEKPNGKLSDADMKVLYEAGFADGRRAAENTQQRSGDFYNVDGTPSWHEMATWCQQQKDRLKDKEREFIDDMRAAQCGANPPRGRASGCCRSSTSSGASGDD
jgi:hypothetical protein